MSMTEKLAANLRELATAYQGAKKAADSTLSMRMGMRSDFLYRVGQGDVPPFQVTGYDRAVKWFATNWPDGAKWPRSIPKAGA